MTKTTRTIRTPVRARTFVIFRSKVFFMAWLITLALAIYLDRSPGWLLGILIGHLIILLIEWSKVDKQ